MDAGTHSNDSAMARSARSLQTARFPPADCPQCGEEEAATPIPGLPRRQSFGGVADYTFGICRHCGEVCGLVVTLESLEGDLSTRAYGFPRPLVSMGPPSQEPTLSANDIVVPPYMPAWVETLFRQARHNLVLRNWDAAGMTYRKTLEVALRTKFAIKGGNLASVIDVVSETQPSTLEIFAWLTRTAGNEAAHESEFSEAASLPLDSHVEQLAVYLFTVPEVKARAMR